ncbi:MAG: ParB N-terminal domain-containing protein [Alcaligenaceae bacterium]|nr:ParB N-terminal domain-containing protein [Alcaligenaceae bacterium]
MRPPIAKEISVSKLHFDPENPRFPIEVAQLPAEELIERFIRDERLTELVSSIADQGYFAGEPLLVVKVGNTDSFHVIEGNRRLAALKLLHREIAVPAGRFSIEEEVEQAKQRPNPIPCLVFHDRKDILRYLGFRHITGIKSWGALQKARYLKQIRDALYSEMPSEEQTQALAREIGSRSDYVAQILTALNLYEHAERKNFYGVQGLSPENIEFSLLSTAISYSNITLYLGLVDRKDMHSSTINDENLKNILTWMFAAPDGRRPILGDSRNIRKLSAVVQSAEAKQTLLNTGDLEEAFLQSEGPSIAFSHSLNSIHALIKQAWNTLPSVEIIEESQVEQLREMRKLLTSLFNAALSKSIDEDTDA